MPTTRAMAKAGGSNAVQSEQNKPPPRKKVKVAKTTTSSSKRRVKLSLARLLDLPPEIFTEIAIYLLPADLLSLARSNKFFRKLFMSRASQRLWKTAIRNVLDMPDCPPELSEPQYVSLLYSKTCSSCGARVLRQMDPYLLVRLCNTCRDKEIQVLYMFDPVYPLVPRSDLMKTPEHGIIYTFKSEYREVMARPEREDEESQWYKDRTEEIYKRQTRGEDLEDFMNMLEDERDAELDELRMQRWRQIKELVSEDGWTNRDMFPSPDNRAEWRKLVGQPKPITDRIWANLYPKLLPLLKSNREYNERIDKEARRRKRITMLQNMAEHMRAALPPLVHVTMKHPPQPQSPTPSTSSAPTAPAGYYPDVKVEFPFPTIAELATWPMIKHILDDDTSPEETETKFTAIRDDVDRMVREWRDKIEQDLIEIWNIGRDGVRGQKLEQSKSKGKGKRTAVKKTTKRETRSSKGKATAETELAMPSLPTAELVIPEFTVTFARPDGTTTTNLSDLPPNLQLLLRADTIFAGEVIEHSYPGIVPRFLSSGAHFGCASSMCHGQRWDSNKFTRDDDCSALAKLMLARTGRPDATSAEMKALRGNLSCGRCNSGWPDTWDYLASRHMMKFHYHKEQLQWKLGQTIIQAKPQAGFVYANTHDLGPGNDKIFARFTTPQESAQHLLLSTVSNMPMMRCLKCDEMGIDARYFHTYHGEQESPIAEHLRDVHNVMQALPGLHFRRWEYDIDFYDPWAEEEDDFDSDMEDEFWDMID